MIEGYLTLHYDDEDTARSVFDAVSPDDYEAGDFFIKSMRSDKSVNVQIRSKRLGTLLETLDDFLSCVQIAERSIKALY